MPGDATIPFAIGSHEWPGLSKLNEECGETVQVIGKIMAFPLGGPHPDGEGRLDQRLFDEIADILGTLDYFLEMNRDRYNAMRLTDRRLMKRERFFNWHADERAKDRPEI